MNETPHVRIHTSARTETGPVRRENQDSFLVADLGRDRRDLQADVPVHDVGPSGTLLLVADGLGGERAGAEASRLAVETIHTSLHESRSRDGGDPAPALKEAMLVANEKLLLAARADPRLEGMATTVTAALVVGDRLHIAHIGDSRAYLVRQGAIAQLTSDHTVLEKVYGLPPDEARRDPEGNVLAQAVGGKHPEVAVEQSRVDLCDGDVLLLCSDGLHDFVTPEEMVGRLKDRMDLPQACVDLVDLALAHGSDDNVTVLLAHCSGLHLPRASSGARVEIRRQVEVMFDPEALRLVARPTGEPMRAVVDAEPKEDAGRRSRRFLPLTLASAAGLGATFLLGWFFGDRGGPGPSAEAGAVTLFVHSEPDSALVLVDGAIRGMSPAAVEVRPGKHRLQIHRAGFEAWMQEGEFGADDTLRAVLQPTPVPVVIRVDPAAFRIELHKNVGRGRSAAGELRDTLRPGKYRVVLSSPDGAREQIEISFPPSAAAGELLLRIVKPRTAAAALAPGPNPEPPGQGAPEQSDSQLPSPQDTARGSSDG